MAWTESRIFREWLRTVFEDSGTGYTGLEAANACKAALFSQANITPDRDAVVGSTGYNTGVWVTGQEKTGASEWVAGGRVLASAAVTTPSTGVCMFDAADLTGSATITMSDVGGCLVYADLITAGSVADQGICYNWFGGAQSVTSGTFSLIWDSSGILRITV